MTHYVVFDLETSPDLDMARRLLGLGPEVVDDAVREAIGKRYSRDGQAPIDVFLKPPLHQILCIGALFAERQDDGAYIVRRLGFDLPILRYRALAHGAPVPALFANSGRDYWYRFGRDHIDLCDMLAGFGASARPSLGEMAALLGIPAKLGGMDGTQVEALARAGHLDEIAAYCLGDVIVTFRLMLRFALVRGEIDDAEAATSEASLDAAIVRHLEHWPLLAGIRQDSSLG